ncbi:MAG: 4'-phosphopantetheinyl transferase family protein [Myxococcaceae bacterium]
MMPAPPLPLPGREVHAWFLRLDRSIHPDVLTYLWTLLDEDERARHSGFRAERHRREFLLSHALLRLTLSRYGPVRAQDWVFHRGEHGRPEVPGQAGPKLRFNLSHTDGMALCAVAMDIDVGVDVEEYAQRSAPTDVVDQCFTAEEVADLNRLSGPRQRRRFFEYWTLKEAYVKARGVGLSLPLTRFAFRLAPPHAPRISFEQPSDDTPESWQFVQLAPSHRHLAAVAIRRPAHSPVTVRCSEYRLVGER